MTTCSYDLMTMCWDVNPRSRPTFPRLVTAVDDVIKNLIRARADGDAGMHVIAIGQGPYMNNCASISSSPNSDPIAVDYLTPTVGTFVFEHPLSQQVIDEVEGVGVRSTSTAAVERRRRRRRLPTVGNSDTGMSEDGSDDEENASLFARRRRRIDGGMSDSGIICALSRRGYSVSEETSSNSDSVSSPRTDFRMDVFGGEGHHLIRQPVPPPPWCPPV